MPTFFHGHGDLIFIHIPKCAGTSVRKALTDYQEKTLPELGDHAYRYRWHESFHETQELFNKWDKERWEQATVISTIRHPVERAVSWWKYRKIKSNANLLLHAEDENKHLMPQGMRNHVLWDATTSAHPLMVPEEYKTYNDKECACRHEKDPECVREFNSLSFQEYLNRLTVWNYNGCAYPSCPYHVLAPQVAWLWDKLCILPTGDPRADKINLFLVEELEQLQRFLPEMGLISLHNVSRRAKENYLDYVTGESISMLNKMYAEDFRLYNALKKSSSYERTPVYFTKQHKEGKE